MNIAALAALYAARHGVMLDGEASTAAYERLAERYGQEVASEAWGQACREADALAESQTPQEETMEGLIECATLTEAAVAAIGHIYNSVPDTASTIAVSIGKRATASTHPFYYEVTWTVTDMVSSAAPRRIEIVIDKLRAEASRSVLTQQAEVAERIAENSEVPV